MRQYIATLLAGASLLAPASAFAADNFAIFNTRVVTNEGSGVINGATVLVEDGKIKAIGKTDTANLPTANGTSIIDGSAMWVTPGIFSGFSTMGLAEVELENDTNDIQADDAANNAGLRAADGFNPKSTVIPVTRAEGITHGAISLNPANSIFAGTGAIIDTTGEFDSVVNPAAFVYVALGQTGADMAGGSRPAALNMLRNSLTDAGRRYGSPDDGDAASRTDAAALAPIISGRIPLMIGADRASDIIAATALKTQFPKLNLIILGGAEAWMVTDAIKAANASVLIDPNESLPGTFEQIGTRLDNARRLDAAGIRYAFMARTAWFSHQARLLPQHAGNAVTNGLGWDAAFKAITLTPSAIFGKPELGVLKTGATANLVVWDGDPLEVMSAPVRVVIDGEQQDLTSRQSQLASRYNPTSKDTRAYKYRR